MFVESEFRPKTHYEKRPRPHFDATGGYWINGYLNTGGNRMMVAAATIVSMAAAKKAQQNVFALYHSYNRTILLGFIWILDFHLKIVLVLRRRYLVPRRCNNGKRKMWPWRWLHHFDFQPWRWLHALMTMVALFRAGNFDTHTAGPLQTNMLIGSMNVVKCYTCNISGAYAHLDCIDQCLEKGF